AENSLVRPRAPAKLTHDHSCSGNGPVSPGVAAITNVGVEDQQPPPLPGRRGRLDRDGSVDLLEFLWSETIGPPNRYRPRQFRDAASRNRAHDFFEIRQRPRQVGVAAADALHHNDGRRLRDAQSLERISGPGSPLTQGNPSSGRVS